MRTLNPWRGLRHLPADVWIIFATTLVNRAGVMGLPFLILYVTKYLHVPANIAGLAISAYGIGGLVTAPLAGRLADRIGPFAVLRGSLVLTGAILLLIPLARAFPVILALTFLWAFVADAARPATMAALTVAVLPEQRKAAIAVNRLAINLGMSIGPAIGGFLAMVSFPLIFVVDGSTSLTAAGLLTILLWLRRRKRGVAVAAIEHGPTDHSPAPADGLAPAVWRHRAALAFFLTALLVNVVFTQAEGALPLFLVRDLHYRESFYGLLFVVNTLLIVAIEVPLNLALSHWRDRLTIALSATLMALGFGALAFARTPAAIVATVIVWTFGEMTFFPTGAAYVAALAPSGRTGEYMGAFAATFSLALIVGPWAGAASLDRFGVVATWTAAFGCGLSAAALTLVVSPAHSPDGLYGVTRGALAGTDPIESAVSGGSES